jgi:hypothetical protein
MSFAVNVHPCDGLSIGAGAIIAGNTRQLGRSARRTQPNVSIRWSSDTKPRLHPTADEWGRDSHDPFYPYGGSLLEIATDTAARIGADSARQLEEYYLGKLLPTTTADDLHHRSVLAWSRSPSSSAAGTRSP